jgi:hypothetical protein
MTGAVAAYSGPSSAVSTNHATAPASSQSTAGIAWLDGVLTFDDLPAEARRLAPDTGVLAQAVIAVPGIAIRNGIGIARQRRAAFRAYANRAVLLSAEREMTKRADGRYKPASPWSITESKTLSTAGGAQAIRRTGTVAAGRLAAEPSSASVTETPKREHLSGITTAAYLPPDVRARLLHEIPTAENYMGELIQWQRGKSFEQEIVLLRHGTSTAIVVQARRPDGNPLAPWNVTQLTYPLASSAQALSS